MKLCVVVPSIEYLKQAGVRIRYGRLRRPLAERGVAVEIKVADELTFPELRDADVYLFSKVLDARSILLAHELSAAGRVIGVDLFDDYFSQVNDSRFVRIREWARAIAPFVHFSLCSTARMAEVAATLSLGASGVVMNDPHDGFDHIRLAARIDDKLARCRAERVIRLAWFGIGDNPNFAIGLTDLCAFSGTLAALAAAEYRVELEIMTNRRALTAEALEMLRQLSVPYRISEWLAAAEAALIDRSLACFIPVNGQLFSIAKSLNRAVSALTGGAQLLSSGYPLYDVLRDFIYRSPSHLLDSIRTERLLLRRETLPGLVTLMDRVAEPEAEAETLAGALRELVGRHLRKPGKRPRLAVLHGHRHAEATHKLAQRLGHVSAASPLCLGKLRYDIRFGIRAGTGALEARLTTKAQRRLAPGIAAPRDEEGNAIGPRLLLLRADPALAARLRAYRPGALGSRISSFEPIMAACASALTALFPRTEVIVAEHEPPLLASTLGSTTPAAVVAGMPILVLPDDFESQPTPVLAEAARLLATVAAGSTVVTEQDSRNRSVTPGPGGIADALNRLAIEREPSAVIVVLSAGALASGAAALASERGLPLAVVFDEPMLDLLDAADKQDVPGRAGTVRLLLKNADVIICDTAAAAARVAAIRPEAAPPASLTEDGTSLAMLIAGLREAPIPTTAPPSAKRAA